MLKILQARLQQYMNRELPDVQAGFRKGRGTRDQIAIIHSVQFSPSVVSDSFRPHELQHSRPPCPSPTPGVHSNSCPSSRWCHPAISSSVIPFSSCPQSLPASEYFPMSQFFAWGGQSIGVTASDHWKSKRVPGKHLFLLYAKAFDCVDHNKLWKILKEMGIADHLTYLLRNLYADQEATVRFGHGTTHWFQIGKGVHQGCMLSPC